MRAAALLCGLGPRCGDRAALVRHAGAGCRRGTTPDGSNPTDPVGSFPHIPYYAIGCTLDAIKVESVGNRMSVRVCGRSALGRPMYLVTINALETPDQRRDFERPCAGHPEQPEVRRTVGWRRLCRVSPLGHRQATHERHDQDPRANALRRVGRTRPPAGRHPPRLRPSNGAAGAQRSGTRDRRIGDPESPRAQFDQVLAGGAAVDPAASSSASSLTA